MVLPVVGEVQVIVIMVMNILMQVQVIPIFQSKMHVIQVDIITLDLELIGMAL